MKSDMGNYSGICSRQWILIPLLIFFLVLCSLFSWAAADKQETLITITVTPENPPEGYAFTVTGTLTDASGSPLGNKRVSLESSPDGDPAYPFERIAVDATDRTGRFEFFRGNHTPAEYIRVSYLGNAEYQGSVSEAVPVHNAAVYGAGTHPSRTTGGLMLTGSPDNSIVLLDGEVRGVTPLALNGIESGPHILEIGKPGYQNQTMEVFVAPERKTTFSFSLPPAGINLQNAGIESQTGLHVFSNTSYQDDMSVPLGDPLYSFSKAGVSVDIYGNNTSVNGTNKTQITTLYDEHPFGDGFSMSVIITSDNTPFR
jgi:hypothetical protein